MIQKIDFSTVGVIDFIQKQTKNEFKCSASNLRGSQQYYTLVSMLTNILIILNQCCLLKAKKFSGHLERYCIIWGDFFLFVNDLIKEFIQFTKTQRHIA